MHKAMMNEDAAMINLLMMHGADLKVMNNFQQTPLFYASKSLLTKYGYFQKPATLKTETENETLKKPKMLMEYLKTKLKNLKKVKRMQRQKSVQRSLVKLQPKIKPKNIVKFRLNRTKSRKGQREICFLKKVDILE